MEIIARAFSAFFFSSRRRHTRCSRDWSSDVCSSDLVCIATGTRVFGMHPVRQGRVMHLDYEQGRRLTRTRYQRLAAALGLPGDALRGRVKLRHLPPVNLVTTGFEQALLARVDGYSVCLIDSLRAATPGINENFSDIRAPLDMLGRVS